MNTSIKTYFRRNWLKPLLGTMFFYGSLVLTNELLNLSKEVFVYGASISWVFILLGSSIPEVVSLILPMACLLAGMLGTQALSDAYEMSAAQSLGVGFSKIFNSWIPFGLSLFFISAVNTNLITPISNNYQQSIRIKMTEEAKLNLIKPGGQPWSPPTNRNFSFWTDLENHTHIMFVSKDQVQHSIGSDLQYGIQSAYDGSSKVSIKLNALKSLLLNPIDQSLIRINQSEQQLVFSSPAPKRIWKPTPLRGVQTWNLFDSSKSRNIDADIEIARRFTLPMISASFLLLGVVLGLSHPRFKRSSASFISLLSIVLYYFFYRLIENFYILNPSSAKYILLFGLPILVLLLATGILYRNLRPHTQSWFYIKNLALKSSIIKWQESLSIALGSHRSIQGSISNLSTLRKYLSRAFLSHWLKVFFSIVALHFVITYSNIASDMSKFNHPASLFFKYWFLSIPEFFILVSPIIFLLTTTLLASDLSITNQWNALKSGGLGLPDLARQLSPVVIFVSFLTLTSSLFVVPSAIAQSDLYYRTIIGRPQNPNASRTDWFLSTTGSQMTPILWHLMKSSQWGFPLNEDDMPRIINYSTSNKISRVNNWIESTIDESYFADPFPGGISNDLLKKPDEMSTFSLIKLQSISGDPERSFNLLSRITSFIWGPLLSLAYMAFSFVGPRSNRSRAVGGAIFFGLIFMGTRSFFNGAILAGQLPVNLGFAIVIMILCSLTLINRQRLITKT